MEYVLFIETSQLKRHIPIMQEPSKKVMTLLLWRFNESRIHEQLDDTITPVNKTFCRNF